MNGRKLFRGWIARKTCRTSRLGWSESFEQRRYMSKRYLVSSLRNTVLRRCVTIQVDLDLEYFTKQECSMATETPERS